MGTFAHPSSSRSQRLQLSHKLVVAHIVGLGLGVSLLLGFYQNGSRQR
jgi:hypothetical protein